MVNNVNISNFKEEVLGSDMPVLVDFWAPWCGPCRMIGPVVDEIAEEYQGKLKVCKVNVDEARDISAQYGIISIPTMMVFKNGQEKEKVTGVRPKENIIGMVNPYIEG